MKIVSFKYLGEKDGLKFGEVDTVEGFFFKRTEKRQVFTNHVYWRFLDTGEHTPLEKVETLYKAHEAKEKLKELYGE